MGGRQRTANFHDSEEELLISLANERKHILENKKSDQTSIRDKKNVWDDIFPQFNAKCPRVVSVYYNYKDCNISELFFISVASFGRHSSYKVLQHQEGIASGKSERTKRGNGNGRGNSGNELGTKK